MKIVINKPLKGYNIGDIVKIDDYNNIPLDGYWRDRLKDSKIDNCIEIYKKRGKK